MAMDSNPILAPSFLGTAAPGVHVLGGMGNALSVEMEQGVLQLDTGNSAEKAREMLDRLREITEAPIFAIVYSHGHLGYNDAIATWLEHCEERGDPRPRVIAHENLVTRWKRYRETEGLQKFFAEIQLRLPVGILGDHPLTLEMPNETFTDAMVFDDGNRRVELLWAPSETDDAVALWLPQEKVLYGGAAVTPNIPNIGTPLRTQRYAVRWAETLERLASLDAELMVMEFGPSVEGSEKIRTVLLSMAEALRWVRERVVEGLNEGMGIEEILDGIEYPEALFGLPWMTPTYGHPDFIARDIFRSETGWWDRNPTNLHPATPDASGRAILSAIVDKGAVLARAQELLDAGEPQLALHVIDLLALAPGDAAEVIDARKLKARLCRILAEEAPSFVSQSLYISSGRILKRGAPHPTGIR